MQKNQNDVPEGVCLSCAEDRKARIPEGHMPTWWIGKCTLCGEKKQVTARRDFGITRNLLEDES